MVLCCELFLGTQSPRGFLHWAVLHGHRARGKQNVVTLKLKPAPSSILWGLLEVTQHLAERWLCPGDRHAGAGHRPAAPSMRGAESERQPVHRNQVKAFSHFRQVRVGRSRPAAVGPLTSRTRGPSVSRISPLVCDVHLSARWRDGSCAGRPHLAFQAGDGFAIFLEE